MNAHTAYRVLGISISGPLAFGAPMLVGVRIAHTGSVQASIVRIAQRRCRM